MTNNRRNNRLPRAMLVSLTLVAGLAIYAGPNAVHEAGGQTSATPTAQLTAKNIYGTFCFACHDTTGKGNPAFRMTSPELPDFTETAWQESRSDADLAQSILQGKGKLMLPMKEKLGSVDVKQVVALVRGFKGGKQVIPLESSQVAIATDARGDHGAIIFRQYCAVCHGPDGTGSVMRPAMPPIPDFTSAAFHTAHTDAQIRVSILDGKGTLMPSNRGRITDQQAGLLLSYVRSLGPKTAAGKSSGAETDFEKQMRELEEQLNKQKGKDK